ncbi:MAG: hypothetical protein KIT09_35730 [Bryobacteraceae bacterium]|nr:hypothetical protein [Bryobacteraceae bacterium]
MKKLLIALALSVLAVALLAQTRITPDNISVAGDSRVWVVAGNRLVFARLGKGLTLSQANGEYVLEAAPTTALTWARQDFINLAAPRVDFVLTATPAAESLRVYRNGLLMAPTADYNINSGVVQFTPEQVPQAGDTVSLLYQILS